MWTLGQWFRWLSLLLLSLLCRLLGRGRGSRGCGYCGRSAVLACGGSRDDNWAAGGCSASHCALGRWWVANGDLVATFATEPMPAQIALPCFSSVPLGRSTKWGLAGGAELTFGRMHTAERTCAVANDDSCRLSALPARWLVSSRDANKGALNCVWCFGLQPSLSNLRSCFGRRVLWLL